MRFFLALTLLCSLFQFLNFGSPVIETLWTTLLNKHSKIERIKSIETISVDYAALHQSQTFSSLIGRLNNTSFVSISASHQPYFLINLFNIMTVEQIISQINAKNSQLNSIDYNYSFRLKDVTFTMNDIVNILSQQNTDFLFLLCDGSIYSPNLISISKDNKNQLSELKSNFLSYSGKSFSFDESSRRLIISNWFLEYGFSKEKTLSIIQAHLNQSLNKSNLTVEYISKKYILNVSKS